MPTGWKNVYLYVTCLVCTMLCGKILTVFNSKDVDYINSLRIIIKEKNCVSGVSRPQSRPCLHREELLGPDLNCRERYTLWRIRTLENIHCLPNSSPPLRRHVAPAILLVRRMRTAVLQLWTTQNPRINGNKLVTGSWNITSLTGKEHELVEEAILQYSDVGNILVSSLRLTL